MPQKYHLEELCTDQDFPQFLRAHFKSN
jgi:hypothetical protein